MDLEPGRDVKISKTSWDAVSLEFLNEAAASSKAQICALQFCDGLAFICTIRPDAVLILHRIQIPMPKKKLGSTSASEKAHEKFFLAMAEGLLAHVSWTVVKAVVVAAPGGMKEEFCVWFLEWLRRTGREGVLGQKGKIVKVSLPGSATATNLNPHALTSVLAEPRIAALLADTKSALEQRLLSEFHSILSSPDPSRAIYGLPAIKRASEASAIRHLLLADSLFRSSDVQQRKMYGKLIGEVREAGGQVLIFAPDGTPNAELEKVTGVAAILNFPLFDDDDE